MSITLPNQLHEAAQHRASEVGFATLDDYVAFLVEQDLTIVDYDTLLRRAMAEDGIDPDSIPDEVVQQRKAEIEASLLEGVQRGPVIEMTARDWDDLHRRVRKRIA